MHEVVVRLANVTVRYGGVEALSSVTVDIRSGVHGIVGANGAGKTTLVNVITGLVRPTKGKVEFDGKDVTALQLRRRARLGIVRTFQTAQLFEEMTVQENLNMAARASGFSSGSSRVADLADVIGGLGLSRWLGTEVGQLPYGVKRSVEIARALQVRPRLLVLDEPSSGLDVPDVEGVCQVICAARDAGISVCLVDHNVGLIRAVCSSLTAMKSGSVIADGDPASVLAHEEVIASYVGVEQ